MPRIKSIGELTAQLAVEIDGIEVGCFHSRDTNGISPKVAIKRATWDVDKLIIKMENGQLFEGTFTEIA